MIEFISYDGKWPCLCFGTLKIKVDGKEYSLKNVMISGGSTYFTNGWSEAHIEEGPWTVELDEYPELMKYEKEITDLVNSEVPWGCCGGCI